MNADLLVNNVLAWSAQIAVLIAIAALAAITVKHPRGRLIFWQGVLAIALLLPAVEPWTTPPATADGVVSISTGAATVISSVPAHFTWRREYLLWLAAAGAFARMVWIAAGFLRLRRYRLSARALARPPVPFESANVKWYVSDTVSGPVTFGWLRPSILLPARVAELPDGLREAIACHELVHVNRRDWLFVLAEELVRGVFWFHPAIWYALGQIQLAREQVVDLEVIRLTRDRDRYLEALVAVAAHNLLPDVAPAPLFLKKRHLAARVAAVLKETHMSKARILASLTTVCSAALIAARLAVWFFPFQSPAQMMPDAPGITVDAGAKLMHRSPVFYVGPVTGTVTLEATLNAKGEVTDARVLGGPDELRRPALESVLQWHYSTDGGAPASVQISINFAQSRQAVPPDVTTQVGALEAHLAAARAATPPPAPLEPATIKSIVIRGASPELEQQVRGRLPVHEGDQVTAGTIGQVLAAAREVDEHFNGRMSIQKGQATVVLALNAPPLSLPPLPPANRAPEGVVEPPSSQPATVPPQRIRVGGNVEQNNLLTQVAPEYPPTARQARIQGIVHLTVIIGKDGSVQNIQVISGHPLLVPAALQAVKQWVYKPTLLNGNPVEVITSVDVNFTLSQ